MNVVLAPMAGVTDKPFRQMVRLFGEHVLYTEMVGVESLYRNHPVTRKMMSIQDEHHIIVQLVGVNLNAFEYAVHLAEEVGAVGIDINMGCPVKKLISNGSGSALLKTPDIAAQIVEKVKSETSLPVSVKMRIGWDDASVNAVQFAKVLENAGADQITVHARTKAQGYGGSARWDVVSDVVKNVSVPVYVNGDIKDSDSAKQALEQTKAAGVMVGRGAMGKPWILSEIETGKRPVVDLSELVLKHLDLLLDYYGPHGIYIARKHIAWYAAGQKNVAQFCQRVYAETRVDKLKEMIYLFFKGEK